MDSNHRRHCQQIYSLSPLATREFPHIDFLSLSFLRAEPSATGLRGKGKRRERIQSFRRLGGSGVQRASFADGAGGRIRTPDLLITNVGWSAKALISGAFCSFRVWGSAVYKPALSIQYIRSCSRLGHGLGQAVMPYKIDLSKKSISISITPCAA